MVISERFCVANSQEAEKKKREQESRRHQVQVVLKEIKLRPKTEEHDYEFKVRNVRRFLELWTNCARTRGRTATRPT